MSDTVHVLPVRRVDDSAVAVKYGAHQWWREYPRDAPSAATAVLTLADLDRSIHRRLGVLA
jgi:hypothetical protein